MSMDEAKDIYMMDNDKARVDPNKSHFWGPPGSIQAEAPKGKTRWVSKRGTDYQYDYQTAHARADDPGFEKVIPETCGACRAAQLATDAIRDQEAST